MPKGFQLSPGCWVIGQTRKQFEKISKIAAKAYGKEIKEEYTKKSKLFKFLEEEKK